MQAADLGNSHGGTECRRLNAPRDGCGPLQGEVRPRLVVVADVLLENDEVVEAIYGEITVGSVVEDGADPPPEMFAWLTCGDVADASTFTVTVMFVVMPGFSAAPRVQVVPTHDHPRPPIETKASPEGSVSVTVIVPTVGPAPVALDTASV